MDADGRLIPLVEDDQGEGIKDFVDDEERLDIFKKSYLKKKTEIDLAKDKKDRELLEEINNKLDRLLHIFGNHHLIDGRFFDIKFPGGD